MLKIIFTVAVVYVIWFAFKHKTRIEAAYKEVQDEKARGAGAAMKSKARQPVVQDVVFGHHATLGCHMANESYYRKSPVYWDAASQSIKS